MTPYEPEYREPDATDERTARSADEHAAEVLPRCDSAVPIGEHRTSTGTTPSPVEIRQPDAAGVTGGDVSADDLSARLATGMYDDTLIALVGGAAMSGPDSPVWDDPRFVTWWAEETAARTRRERRRRRATPAEDAAAEQFATRMEARLLGVTRTLAYPELHRPHVPGPPGRVLEYAAEVGATPWVDLAVAAGSGRELWDEDVESWVTLPPDVPPGRYLAIKIAGDSMAPVMHTGDTVLVLVSPMVKPETIIVARHPEDGYVCKRVRRVRPATIELESLAPERPFIVIPRNDALIVGTVVRVWCHHSGPKLSL